MTSPLSIVWGGSWCVVMTSPPLYVQVRLPDLFHISMVHGVSQDYSITCMAFLCLWLNDSYMGVTSMGTTPGPQNQSIICGGVVQGIDQYHPHHCIPEEGYQTSSMHPWSVHVVTFLCSWSVGNCMGVTPWDDPCPQNQPIV